MHEHTSIKLSILRCQLILELHTKRLQNLRAHRKATETRPHPTNVTQVLQHSHCRGMIDLFDLGSITTISTANGNDTILLQSLIFPNLCRRWLLLQSAHNIDVMGGSVHKRRGGDKNLIAPEDGKSPSAGGGVDACLTNDGLEDGDGFVGAIGELLADGEFLLCFAVVNANEKSGSQSNRQVKETIYAVPLEVLTTPGLLLFSLAGNGANLVPFPAV